MKASIGILLEVVLGIEAIPNTSGTISLFGRIRMVDSSIVEEFYPKIIMHAKN